MNKWYRILKDYTLITFGVFIIAIAVYYFMLPDDLVFGSVSGLALVISQMVPLAMSTVTMILNVALLIVGIILIGKEFGGKTIYTSIMLPVFIRIFEEITPNVEPITDEVTINLASFVILISLGQAILFNRNASSGGLDVVAKLMNKYLRMDLGKSIMISGICVIMTALFVYDVSTVVIGLVGTYVNGRVLDSFINGLNMKKRICIISDNAEDIRDFVINKLQRGVTLYPAEGGYTGKERTELCTILNNNEYGELLEYLEELDDKAFVTVSSVGEVIGSWNPKKKKNVKQN